MVEESLGDNAPSGRHPVVTLGILPQNWIVYRAWTLCQQTVVGMSGTLLGVAAQEARAACELLQAPPGEWARITEGVQLMGSIAAELHNERQQQEHAQRAQRKNG